MVCYLEYFRISLLPMQMFTIMIRGNAIYIILQYGPVTMIVPASGHQVRCIPWVQMGTFNKEIGFLCGLKFFALNIFCGEIPTIESTFDVANTVKTATVKDVPINNDVLLNIQTC